MKKNTSIAVVLALGLFSSAFGAVCKNNCDSEVKGQGLTFEFSGQYQSATQSGNTLTITCLNSASEVCATISTDVWGRKVLEAGGEGWILAGGINADSPNPTTNLNEGDLYSVEFELD